jgi:MurNAc alpha-1-phosphate uridylyltransferase
MSDEISLMVFAAGLGTRMGDLVRDKPKPLIEVGGRALLDHALSLRTDICPVKTVVNAHYKKEMVTSYLRSHQVIVLDEWPDVLETGGGLRAALPHLGTNPVMTLNSDAVWLGENPLVALKSKWDPKTMDALLMCVRLQDTVGYKGQGDFTRNANGMLQRKGDLVYSGAQIIKTDHLNKIKDNVFSMNRIWDIMLEKNKIFGMEYNGLWCDVGTPEGVILAEEQIAKMAPQSVSQNTL